MKKIYIKPEMQTIELSTEGFILSSPVSDPAICSELSPENEWD